MVPTASATISATPASVERDTVTRWLDAGRALAEIEHHLLGPARLTDEQRAVLWLYAWGETRRRERAGGMGGCRVAAIPGW